MAKIFVTSDTHFNHKMLVSNSFRQFPTVSAMNEFIIAQWNSVVNNGDTVFHLGDVVMNKKIDFYENILPRLNGNIIFIRGNHDNQTMSAITNVTITFNGNNIELVHNPFNSEQVSRFVIHGHIHKSGTRPQIGTHVNGHISVCGGFTFFNCNLEFHKFKPVLLNNAFGEMLLHSS